MSVSWKMANWRLTRYAVLPLFLVGSVTLSVAAAPAHKSGPPAARTAAAVPAPLPATSGDEIVKGFRTATWGMDEAAVRAAIIKDFEVKPEAIHAADNPVELTHVLTVNVPDLLAGGGTAEVAYVFGYKSKTLIQVGVNWSATTDKTLTPARLFTNANLLRAHFASAGYRPETIASNAIIAGGLLMFRGSDARGHTTVLVLQGAFKPGKDEKQRELTPSSLSLYYIADPKTPDVFKLPPGQF